MNFEENPNKSITSRQAEEENLIRTLQIIRNNMLNYGADVSRMREEIDEMLEHFHDDNPELINLLENTITMHDHLKRALERNEKAQNKPYFGRIIFHDDTTGQQESLYIGRGGILEDATHVAVVDWRAPVANAYYENGLGRCSYPAPDDKPIQIDLQLKRTYEIENGVLQNYYDTEVIANDDLLTKYLSKNKQAVLGEIVATIQKEQNDIIRRSPYHNCLVQGVAGSGKTTVAMHRISYILYNYAERFRPEDFYIVGSNRILLNYITGVLPDLDVYGVRQMTMEQLFIRLLYEDWDDKKYGIKGLDRTGGRGAVKGTLTWFHDLEEYCNQLEQDIISCEDIYLDPMQFIEGFENGKFGVFDRSNRTEKPAAANHSDLPYDRYNTEADKIRTPQGRSAHDKTLVLLVDGSTVENYIRQNPKVSIQSKIDMLNERLIIKINDEFLGKGVKYTEAEKKAILKAYRGRYGANVWKYSILDMYNDFLDRQHKSGYDVEKPGIKNNKICFDVYDLAALAYLYKRVKETEVISEAHHVVIDEAQDYGMMAYSVLKFCIKDCTYTIMGDVSQNIHFGYGLNDWEELKQLYMSTDRASFDILKKSYRNTIEISNFATKILQHGTFSIYPVEPIIRHGAAVQVIHLAEDNKLQSVIKNDRQLRNAPKNHVLDHNTWVDKLAEKTAEICKIWQDKGLETIAIVCRTQEEALEVSGKLGDYIEVLESDPDKTEFGKGIMVLPVEYTKGLEFDAVLIWNPTREAYPSDNGHAKLLYVAATRALHELCVLHKGNLTGLIADPLPVRNVQDMQSPGRQDTKMDTFQMQGQERQGTEISKFSKQTDEISKLQKPVRVTAKVIIPSRAGSPEKSDTSVSVPKVNTTIVAKPVPVPKVRPTIAAKPAAVKNTTGTAFGDIPATEILKPQGHSQIDLSIRWIDKQPDGIYLHSRYGVLRISSVHSSAVRLTFAKGTQLGEGVHSKIAIKRLNRACRYKDSAKIFEFMNDEIYLQVDKTNGAIRYMNRDKKLLLEECVGGHRQLDTSPKAGAWYRLFLKWQKGEQIFGHRIADKVGENMRGTARYISHSDQSKDLPLLISAKGYGILLATDGPVFCCDIPAYGSYLYAENAPQMDFYFIVGKDTKEILAVYDELLGR